MGSLSWISTRPVTLVGYLRRGFQTSRSAAAGQEPFWTQIDFECDRYGTTVDAEWNGTLGFILCMEGDEFREAWETMGPGDRVIVDGTLEVADFFSEDGARKAAMLVKVRRLLAFAEPDQTQQETELS